MTMRNLPKLLPWNDRGVIFVTVLVLTLVIAIVVVGAISILTTHTKSGQDVVDNIKAELLAVGEFYRYQQNQLQGGTFSGNDTVILDQKTYTAAVLNDGNLGGSTPQATNQIRVTISY